MLSSTIPLYRSNVDNTLAGQYYPSLCLVDRACSVLEDNPLCILGDQPIKVEQRCYIEKAQIRSGNRNCGWSLVRRARAYFSWRSLLGVTAVKIGHSVGGGT